MRFKQLIQGKNLLLLSMLLFVASLGFQCYYCEGDSPDWSFGSPKYPGYLLLILGWFGVLITELAWLANPFYGVVMALAHEHLKNLKKPEKSGQKNSFEIQAGLAIGILVSVSAVMLSLSFLFQTSTCFVDGPLGNSKKIAGYGPGYVLWGSAMVLQLFWVRGIFSRRDKVKGSNSRCSL